MIFDINDIFPEEISDEAAFYVVEFILNLGPIVESHYYSKVKKYLGDCRPSKEPKFLTCKKDIDDSF